MEEVEVKKYYLQNNNDLEGWDVLERDGIHMEEGWEDSVIATFYEKVKALKYVEFLNNNYLSD